VATIQVTSRPYRYRLVFTDATYQVFDFSLCRGIRTIDLVFEDTSGNAVLGYLAPGFALDGQTPGATEPKAAAWSWVAERSAVLPYLSVALANNHAVTLIVT